MQELSSDFTLITDRYPDDANHPAWPAFQAEMCGKAYGRSALLSAWSWFQSGWDALATSRDVCTGEASRG